ncbi:isopentenyl-diphosphate delta-isomerase [Heliophilum fasciatum]|uniref:Isopentenyl-diphosphate delta-isomerase n=1 Tax=Heliophilum fasciatum TaxID=35700 RepID=A0A4R2RJB7_9FIRM|nr:isopentenyl-diphosphate delta-isomerase [Heliophilum fasciatum]MCW2278680.1 isopentenyl-diphosphate delta-isomerase [Heliophilum fasciatum]TCP62599.1 isopentenyl-diphosphate delta-isomerase [Heliophilum fasciatum]
MEQRQQRKLDHIRHALALADGPQTNGFEDVRLVPQALSGVDMNAIDLGCAFLGKRLRLPLLINAITGGTAQVTGINAALGRVARQAGVALAVGSQAAAIRDASLWPTYRVARQANPDGVLIANVNPNVAVADALRAIEAIEADGLQVHVNVAQELNMTEGDRDFHRWLDNIAAIVKASPVPVIVKEVGCGISAEVTARLLDAGVRYIDTGGAGGTNFVAIEQQRRQVPAVQTAQDAQTPSLLPADQAALMAWGLPTAVSLAEVLYAVRRFRREARSSTAVGQQEHLPAPGDDVHVIASGGVRGGFEVAKALVMGASLVAVAGEVLRYLLTPQGDWHESGEQAALDYLDRLQRGCATAMTMVGSGDIASLQRCPYVLTGATQAWLSQRGMN